jgi:hypothetical protein
MKITIGRPEDSAQGKIRVLAQFGGKPLGKFADVTTGLKLAPESCISSAKRSGDDRVDVLVRAARAPSRAKAL